MSTFKVIVPRRPEKSLDRIEEKYRTRIIQALEYLRQNPVPVKEFDVTKISGSESNYRIRITGFRILYGVNWNEKEITVYDIDTRKGRTYK